MINLGTPSRSVGGAQEIHYDSGQMRAAYEAGNHGGVPAAEPMGPMISGMGGPNVELPVEMGALDPEILKALAAGEPPPVNRMPQPNRVPAPIAQVPSNFAPQGGAQSSTTMILPLGGGVTAQVIFTGRVPKARHWERLIKHMQIEAVEMEADHAEAEREAADEAAAAAVLRQALEGLAAQRNMVIANAGSGGGSEDPPRSVKRRVRKNERGVATSAPLSDQITAAPDPLAAPEALDEE